jgi:single-stranded-DNA-specific exonuclease
LKKRWNVKRFDETSTRYLEQSLGITKVTAAILAVRGVTEVDEARELLQPTFTQIQDPFLMLDMQRAVERVIRAISAKEKILIYGDYDVDGTMGTIVMRRALHMLGAQTSFHVPHRFTEGYGVRQVVLERAKAEGYKLVITVDCGVSAHEPIAWAKTNDLDCIVTDHHLPDTGCHLPPAFAILNPNQRGCSYPDKGIAGVGVAFKLVQALFKAVGSGRLAKGFLKVVAIGTIADMAPLTGENRAIVALGLADLPKAVNPGLRALLKATGCLDAEYVSASDVGFRIGPRINAAGRLDAARLIIDLFETEDANHAEELASRLESLNATRQELQQRLVRQALLECGAELDPEMRVVILAGEKWHRGFEGIVAAKVAERLGVPCVVISIDGEIGRGSVRSLGPFNVLEGLTACADLLETYGGHVTAAGLTIRPENIPAFRHRFNEHAIAHFCEDSVLHLDIDYELSPPEITHNLYKDLRRLEPFGTGWPQPIFLTRALRVSQQPKLMKDRHLKMWLSDESGSAFESVWWGAAGTTCTLPRKGDVLDVVYTLEEDSWQGSRRLRLIVRDVQST